MGSGGTHVGARSSRRRRTSVKASSSKCLNALDQASRSSGEGRNEQCLGALESELPLFKPLTSATIREVKIHTSLRTRNRFLLLELELDRGRGLGTSGMGTSRSDEFATWRKASRSSVGKDTRVPLGTHTGAGSGGRCPSFATGSPTTAEKTTCPPISR